VFHGEIYTTWSCEPSSPKRHARFAPPTATAIPSSAATTIGGSDFGHTLTALFAYQSCGHRDGDCFCPRSFRHQALFLAPGPWPRGAARKRPSGLADLGGIRQRALLLFVSGPSRDYTVLPTCPTETLASGGAVWIGCYSRIRPVLRRRPHRYFVPLRVTPISRGLPKSVPHTSHRVRGLGGLITCAPTSTWVCVLSRRHRLDRELAALHSAQPAADHFTTASNVRPVSEFDVAVASAAAIGAPATIDKVVAPRFGRRAARVVLYHLDDRWPTRSGAAVLLAREATQSRQGWCCRGEGADDCSAATPSIGTVVAQPFYYLPRAASALDGNVVQPCRTHAGKACCPRIADPRAALHGTNPHFPQTRTARVLAGFPGRN